MADECNSAEKPNSLKSEHLKEDINPIMACIGTLDQFPEVGIELIKEPYVIERQNLPEIKSAGNDSYVISAIDNLNKSSLSFLRCTGLAATGQDKKTGENISFLSHQDPRYFLNGADNKKRFANDLEERLTELKEKCAEGTIDAVIVGGSYFEEGGKMYLESIKLLSNEVSNILGFEPVVVTGPKMDSRGEDVFYDNKYRRLYIIRHEIGTASTESFIHEGIKRQKEKWGQQSLTPGED